MNQSPTFFPLSGLAEDEGATGSKSDAFSRDKTGLGRVKAETDVFLGLVGTSWCPGALQMTLLSLFQASSPVCTELEMNVMDWLAKMLGLPEHFLHHHPGSQGGGVLQVRPLAKLLLA